MPQQMILHASMKIKDPTCYNYNPMQPNQYFKKKKKPKKLWYTSILIPPTPVSLPPNSYESFESPFWNKTMMPSPSLQFFNGVPH